MKSCDSSIIMLPISAKRRMNSAKSNSTQRSSSTATEEIEEEPAKSIPVKKEKPKLKGVKPARRRVNEETNPWVVLSNRFHREAMSSDMSALFELLWEKATPTSNATNSSYQSCPGIFLPETVCFRSEAYSQPQWYFTSAQDGKIYKKNSVNVTTDNIYRAFTKKSKNQVKRYMEVNKTPCTQVDSNIVAYGVFEHNVVGETYYSTEFFDMKGLKYFLEKQSKETNGFIQKFIHPGGLFNIVLKVNWTPKSIIVETVKNRLKLDDLNYSMKDRATTDESHPNTLVASVVDPSIQTHIEKLCDSLSKHISSSTLNFHSVREMSFNMKLDRHGKIWFLWFNSLITTTNIALPEKPLKHIEFRSNRIIPVKKNEAQSSDPPQNHQNENPDSDSLDFVNTKNIEQYRFYSPSILDNKYSSSLACPSCMKIYESTRSVDISYHVAILEFEQLGHLVEDDADGYNLSEFHYVIIPPIIRTLETTLGPVRYKKQRNSPLFLNKTFKVCPSCARNFQETARQNNMNLLGERHAMEKKWSRPSTRIRYLARSKSSLLIEPEQAAKLSLLEYSSASSSSSKIRRTRPRNYVDDMNIKLDETLERENRKVERLVHSSAGVYRRNTTDQSLSRSRSAGHKRNTNAHEGEPSLNLPHVRKNNVTFSTTVVNEEEHSSLAHESPHEKERSTRSSALAAVEEERKRILENVKKRIPEADARNLEDILDSINHK